MNNAQLLHSCSMWLIRMKHQIQCKLHMLFIMESQKTANNNSKYKKAEYSTRNCSDSSYIYIMEATQFNLEISTSHAIINII